MIKNLLVSLRSFGTIIERSNDHWSDAVFISSEECGQILWRLADGPGFFTFTNGSASGFVLDHTAKKREEMQDVRPPEPEAIARFIAVARIKLPRIPFFLSRPRPPGHHRMETDTLALEAGINRVAIYNISH